MYQSRVTTWFCVLHIFLHFGVLHTGSRHLLDPGQLVLKLKINTTHKTFIEIHSHALRSRVCPLLWGLSLARGCRMIFFEPHRAHSRSLDCNDVLTHLQYMHVLKVSMAKLCFFLLYWPPLCSCDPCVLNINTLFPTWSAKSFYCSYRVLQMIELSQKRSTMWFFFLVDKDITDTSVLLVPSYPQCSQWGSQLCKHVNHRIEFLEHCENTTASKTNRMLLLPLPERFVFPPASKNSIR